MKSNVKSSFLTIVVALALVIPGVLAFNEYVEFLVDKKVKNDDFIQTVASNVRPFLIFDETGVIVVDKGAWKYVNKIVVTPGKKGQEPKRIVVAPKDVLNVAPILEPLDADFAIHETREGNMNWVYQLGRIRRILKQGSAKTTRWRFRLEILK